MINLRGRARSQLARHGWFLRRIAGLPAGVCLEYDLLETVGISVPRIVLDVGAHRGETAERFVRAFPEARVFSFEPVSANFAVLESRSRSWPSVSCHKLALSDRIGEVEIVLQSDSQTHSLESIPDRAYQPAKPTETVQLTTLDSFAEAHQFEGIDLLKLDTEGHELAILRGSQRLLNHGSISSILLEASLDPADRVHTALTAAAEFLRPHGFNLAAIYDQATWRHPARLAYFNALFIAADLSRVADRAKG